ncbi:MAG: hypothetical protein VYC11_01275 [Candidatus Thermoplasmatota archaeon]|nr:hypothetical protein [Candidatus Thermoplasmatota archaeon]
MFSYLIQSSSNQHQFKMHSKNIRAASVQSAVTVVKPLPSQRAYCSELLLPLQLSIWSPGTGRVAPVLALYAAQLKWISKSPAPIQNLRGTIFVPVLLGCLLEQLYMMALYVTLVVLALVLSFKAAALLFLYAILGAQTLSGKLALIFLCRLPAARGFVAQFACGASTILC